LLGELGIHESTLVVAYSEVEDYNSSYLIWTLDYIGHTNSSLLEGGFNMWSVEKGSVTQDAPQIEPVRYPVPSELSEEVRATLEDVKEVVRTGEGILLDVGSLDTNTVQKEPGMRKGHIQGVLHHFVGEDLNADGTWRKKAELKKQYEKLGVAPDTTIIVFCGSGMISSKAYFTLKHVLGYPSVKNYDGRFTEWASLEELSLESGVSALPDPEKLLQSRCTVCHNLNRVYKEKEERAGWEKIIHRMIKRGAKLDETERMTLVEFLVKKGK
jgi:thiosulfate/3-mercaptopyruvate sulfurtransferase